VYRISVIALLVAILGLQLSARGELDWITTVTENIDRNVSNGFTDLVP
jgi:hypothetical protein